MIMKTSSYNISKSSFLHCLYHVNTPKENLMRDTIRLLQNNINNYSKNGFISIEAKDINLVLEDSQKVLISSIKASTILAGIRYLIDSILTKNEHCKISNGIIVHFSLNNNYTLSDVSNCMGMIYDAMDEDASVAFCISIEENIENIKIHSLIGYTDDNTYILGEK